MQRPDAGLEYRLLPDLLDVVRDLDSPGRRPPRSAPDGSGRPGAARASGARSHGAPRRSRQDHRRRRVVDDEVDSVSGSSARMLRPSRPMIRPFISSDRAGRPRRWSPRRGRRRPAASVERMLRAAVGVAPRLLLDVADQTALSWRSSSLELLEQDLLCLAHAQAGDSLELAQRPLPRLLQLLSSGAPGCARGPRASARAGRARRGGRRATAFPRMRSSARRLGPPFAQLMLDVADRLRWTAAVGSARSFAGRRAHRAGAGGGRGRATGAMPGRAARRWASTRRRRNDCRDHCCEHAPCRCSGSLAVSAGSVVSASGLRVPARVPGCVGSICPYAGARRR